MDYNSAVSKNSFNKLYFIYKIAEYQYIRAIRRWLTPVLIIISIALGLLSFFSKTVNNQTGMNILMSARDILPILVFIITIVVALSVNPEADEDSYEMLWVLPVRNNHMLIGKFLGIIPLIFLAFIGFFLPIAVGMAIIWSGSGLSFTYLLKEYAIALLLFMPTYLISALIGFLVGTHIRGFILFETVAITLLCTTMPQLIVKYTMVGISLLQLLDWIVIGPLRFYARDLYSLEPYLFGVVIHQIFYLVLAVFIFLISLRFIKSERSLGEDKTILNIICIIFLSITISLAYCFINNQNKNINIVKNEIKYYKSHYNNSTNTNNGVHSSIKLNNENQFLDINKYKMDIDVTKPPVLKINTLIEIKNLSDKIIENPMLTLRHNFDIKSVIVDGNDMKINRDGDGIYFNNLTIKPQQKIEVKLIYYGVIDEWRYEDSIRAKLTYFVKKYGFLLPENYGWYPTTKQVPLSTVIKNTKGEILDDSNITAILQNDANRIYDTKNKIVLPEKDKTEFEVIIHKGGNYKVVSNIGYSLTEDNDVKLNGRADYIIKAFARGDLPLKLKSWLFRIATNLLKDLWRSATYKYENNFDILSDNIFIYLNVSLKFKPEVVALIGPNGSGKTSLLRIITGLDMPDNGNIELDGEKLYYSTNPNRGYDYKIHVDLKSRTGYVPQSNIIHIDLSVKEAMEYLSSLRGHYAKKRVDMLIKSWNLKEIENKSINKLSPGERRRFLIAQSLLNDPELWVLDEPTSGLDSIERKALLNSIMMTNDKVVVYATHILEDAFLIADRIIILNNGNILFDGSKKDLIKEESENKDKIDEFEVFEKAYINIIKDNGLILKYYYL